MNTVLQVIESPTENQIDLIRDELRAFNNALVGKYKGHPFVIYARVGGELVGGMYGWLSWGWFHLDIAWVHESHRGKGIGTRLLRACEQFAIDHQILNARTNTGSFQAPDFYLKNGYEVFAQLDIIAPNGSAHQDYFLKKRLKP